MAAFVSKEAVGTLLEPRTPQAVGTTNSTGNIMMSSDPDARGPTTTSIGDTRTTVILDSKDKEQKKQEDKNKARTLTEKTDSDGQRGFAGTTGDSLKYSPEDSADYKSQDMLHYLGPPLGEAGFALGTNCELTRERIRQLARARLAEQERMRVHHANFILRQEAAAAMQQNVSLANVTVASKPLYPIGAPRRVRAPKHPGHILDHVQHHHPSLFDGPLNLTSRSAAMPVSYATHAALSYPVLGPESPGDLNKPLDLSMKSDRQVVMTRLPPKSVGRMMHMSKTDMVGQQSHTMCSSTNNHGEVSMASARAVYRPPPMMSYGKAGHHGNSIHPNAAAHYLSMLPKAVPASESPLHSLASSGIGHPMHSSRTPVKRPAPVLAHSMSDIPVKRIAHSSSLGMPKEHHKVAASSSIPGPLRGYQEPNSKVAFLAYERGRNHAVALMNQANQDSQLQIADNRSLNASHPDPGPIVQARPHHSTAKPGSPSVFHHIHHHHHHHHVPSTDKKRLHPLSNEAAVVHARGGAPVHPTVLAQSSGGLLPANGLPANGLPAHAVPVRQLAGHMITGHDAPSHPVAASSIPQHGGRQRGVLIKHTANSVSTGTSPHLRRSHYHTRRRHHSISPPTLASSMASFYKDSMNVTSSGDRAHQHNRAMSPLKLVESSIEAGAKMNELLKPLDGPEQSPLSGYCATNNNKKVLVTEKLARPLRVDIPDDRAFISHLGDMSAESTNPVPLVRQVSNAASTSKCLTSEVSSSPKKSNSSGNESPTMPVLTPQSVYSPCFATESATNSSHISSNKEPPLTSSPMFYNALTLPLYPRKQDASNNVRKSSLRKDDSPPRLQESGPEHLVSEYRVQNRQDLRPEGRAESLLQKQSDNYMLNAAFDKNKQDKLRLREAMREQREAYQRYVEYHIGPLEHRNKQRKKHTHSYGLKASMDKLKARKKIKQGSQQAEFFGDRNIFADLVLQRMWHEARTAQKTSGKVDLPPQQTDVIDLTSSPSISPAPDAQESTTSEDGVKGGIDKKPPQAVVPEKDHGGIRSRIFSAMGEANTLSVGEAIDVVLKANLPQSRHDGLESQSKYPSSKSVNQETDHLGRLPKDTFYHKDQPPKLVKAHLLQTVTSSQASATCNTCPVITSASSSAVLPPSLKINEVIDFEASTSLSSPQSLPNCPSVLSYSVASPTTATVASPTTATVASPTTASVPKYDILDSPPLVTSCMTSFPPHLKFSPTEKTFSHDPRKKLLAAMGALSPSPGICSALSPVSFTASLSSTVSPSSGRSTPSKSSARKRSLEISRLENTSSYVVDAPKRKQTVDLLTDPALLDREERALQRAMKRFNEMERKEKETPTGPPIDTYTHSRKFGRVVLNKHSQFLRRGRGRGRKLLGYHRMRQIRKQEWTTVVTAIKRHRGFSREIRRLTCQVGRASFKDFIPQVLEERTRHSQATRSSARERKVYHKNARYEMEIEKEERKFLERKRQKRSVGGSISGDEDCFRAKLGPGRRRKGPDDVFKTSSESNMASKEDSMRLDTAVVPTNHVNVAVPTNHVDAAVPMNNVDQTISEEGVAKSSGLDTPLHVVIDPTNHNKMKFMTSTAYEMHRKDSGKENQDGDRGETKGKAGGKRKFKMKHLGPATFASDADAQQEGNICNSTEVLSPSSLAPPTPAPSPDPPPLKVVKPAPPAEMKRLMVNKKLGETILHRAARLAYNDVAIYCIDYDVVDINSKDNAGYTPLHECCVHGRLRVALHLLQHGADVNASASDGTRPIHDAVDNNWLALVRLLLTYGADPLIATYSGRTTIKLAKTKAMKTFIIGYLADVNGEWELDEEDPYQNDLDLGWYLSGTRSFDADGLPVADIFQDIPAVTEPSTEEFLLELSETPHLTSYNIRLPNDQRARNWLLMSDVTTQLKTMPTDLLAVNPSLRHTTMSCDEFNAAIKGSQLNSAPVDKSQLMLDEMSGDYIVEMLELNGDLRRILHIEEEYV